MGKPRRIVLKQVTHSLLPAIVVVQTSDNGKTLITPVPLENSELSAGIIMYWVAFALWLLITRCWQIVYLEAWQLIDDLQSLVKRPPKDRLSRDQEKQTPLDWLVEIYYRTIFGFAAGASRPRSLAWGVLGI